MSDQQSKTEDISNLQWEKQQIFTFKNLEPTKT